LRRLFSFHGVNAVSGLQKFADQGKKLADSISTCGQFGLGEEKLVSEQNHDISQKIGWWSGKRPAMKIAWYG
jgi:hypothetical protein